MVYVSLPLSLNSDVRTGTQTKAEGQNVVGCAYDRLKSCGEPKVSLDMGVYVPPPLSPNLSLRTSTQTEEEDQNVVGCAYDHSKPGCKPKISLDGVYVSHLKDEAYLHRMGVPISKTQCRAYLDHWIGSFVPLFSKINQLLTW